MGVEGRAGQEAYRSRVRGCLVGGAVGDALGAPVEFRSLAAIRAEHGPDGVRDLIPGADGVAVVTDDTQMTLFTAEGLIRAGVRADRGICHPPSVVHQAYLRWLATQELPGPPEQPSGWLAGQAFLYARRAPGNACLSGLAGGTMGTPEAPRNPDSKGCGAVMRSAPFGLIPWRSPEQAFDLAAECAVQTHGHPTGYLAAGVFAAIVRFLLDGHDLAGAVAATLPVLAARPGHEETTAALRAALAAAERPPSAEAVEALGGGWVAEEALAIGVYAALAAPPRAALLLSVNHSGDSDSTGSICGNLLGAEHGETALPPDWVAEIEGRGVILQVADDLAAEFTQSGQLHGDWGPHTRWKRRYPGG
ncbi:ADP-ribosylglycohydrolase family protein [Spirilliplanes yamanashiensis]|uniref:ADP-ribosylglycohydrolase n=1 Tax=Spirilliplanes yamanashiensis TaxID=42233 RepID=A0A8J4DLK4_9ACTN|nr:ADP-ribosylglycohydrolase family protein [Spirilliplanes yamanashiensis]MDP9816559.1 ADP-ribosylglycohydrolase [Spirilliplanes yamanashiensis]GIJ06086.1 ADP-ribosylglycohydrolase [Spirilliplanes yamanashiensis]